MKFTLQLADTTIERTRKDVATHDTVFTRDWVLACKNLSFTLCAQSMHISSSPYVGNWHACGFCHCLHVCVRYLWYCWNPSQQLALSHMGGGAVLTPAQLLDQQKKANATMIELEERRLEKMQRRQVMRLQ